MKKRVFLALTLVLVFVATMLTNFSKVEAANSKPIISVLGDSISTHTDVTGVSNVSYYGTWMYNPAWSNHTEKYNMYRSEMYWQRFADKIGGQIGVVSAAGGSGFCAPGNQAQAFTTDARINSLDDKGKPDIIIVYGGTNDWNYNKNSIMNGFYTTANKIRKAYPNSLVIYTGPYYIDGASDDKINFINLCMKNYCDTDSKSIYVDLRSTLRGSVYSDDMAIKYNPNADGSWFHPNTYGHQKIADSIYLGYFCYWYSHK